MDQANEDNMQVFNKNYYGDLLNKGGNNDSALSDIGVENQVHVENGSALGYKGVTDDNDSALNVGTVLSDLSDILLKEQIGVENYLHEENVSALGDKGVTNDNDSALNVGTVLRELSDSLVREQIGGENSLSTSGLMEALNTNNGMSVDDLNESQETVEFNVSVIEPHEPHDSENYVNETPINKRKGAGLASYCESDSSLEEGSDEEYKADDDDDDEDIPLRKKPRHFKSTPKNNGKSGGTGRKAGRPPGSKNKQGHGQKSAAGGHNIKKPKKSKSQLDTETLQLNKAILNKKM